MSLRVPRNEEGIGMNRYPLSQLAEESCFRAFWLQQYGGGKATYFCFRAVASRSRCVVQKYGYSGTYTRMPWHCDSRQMEKQYCVNCVNVPILLAQNGAVFHPQAVTARACHL